MSEAGEGHPRRPTRAARRDWLRMGLVAVVTALVFWLLFRNVPFATVRDLLASADAGPLILGIAITAIFPLLSAWRWKAILDGLGHRLPLGESFTLIMACWPLATFTPSKGGDLARAWFLRGRSPVSLVLGSVLAERLIDVLVLLAFCLAGSLWFGWDLLAAASGGLLAAGLIGTAILLAVRLPMPERLRPKVDRLLMALRVVLRRPGLLAVVLAATIANWMASVVQTWLFYRALGADAPFGSVLAALPAAIFVGLVPVTLMGMGTRDAALIRLLSPVAAAPVSLGAGLLYSLCGYWLPGLAGIPFLRRALVRESARDRTGVSSN